MRGFKKMMEARKKAGNKAKEFFNTVAKQPGDFYDNTKTALKEQYGKNARAFESKVEAKAAKMVVKCKAKSHIAHCVDCEDYPTKQTPYPCRIARFEPIEPQT